MSLFRRAPVLAVTAVAAVAAAVALGGCGSGSVHDSLAASTSAVSDSAPAAKHPAPAAARVAPAPAVTQTTPTSIGASAAGNYPQTISTARGPDGTHLIGGGGRALYIRRGETVHEETCVGACERVWQPMLVLGRISVSGGVRAADVGTRYRGFGYTQVTFDDKPLYYYTGDPTAGTTHGEGRHAFGGTWYLLAPSGRTIL